MHWGGKRMNVNIMADNISWGWHRTSVIHVLGPLKQPRMEQKDKTLPQLGEGD